VKLQREIIAGNRKIVILLEGRDGAGKDGTIKSIVQHYNRAGVERVIGFCTKQEYEELLATVPTFEHMIERSGIAFLKYYLDISKDGQKRRLKDRRRDPLKQWRISPIDKVAVKRWKDDSHARNVMFARTSTPLTPWHVVRADDMRRISTSSGICSPSSTTTARTSGSPYQIPRSSSPMTSSISRAE
jgi:polyphosphate kinase 2 (PPK2 family)